MQFFFYNQNYYDIMAWQHSTMTGVILCGPDSLPEHNSVQVFKPLTKAKLVFPVTSESGKVGVRQEI